MQAAQSRGHRPVRQACRSPRCLLAAVLFEQVTHLSESRARRPRKGATAAFLGRWEGRTQVPGTEPAWGLPWGVNRAREPIVIVPGRGGRAQGHLRGAAGGSGQGGAGREQRLQGEHLAGGLLFAQTLLPTPWFSIPGHRLASSWERVSWSFATFGGIRCLDVRPLTSACRVPPAPPRGPCGGRKRPCSPPPSLHPGSGKEGLALSPWPSLWPPSISEDSLGGLFGGFVEGGGGLCLPLHLLSQP